jgi:hypothetical protein
MTTSPEDTDPANTDPQGSLLDVPTPAPAEQSEQSNDEFPDEPAAPGSQSPAGQSAQVDDESVEAFPASDPTGNY